MTFSCGIIGLPNVGKSTIFNALTSAKAQAANFPFCTIEPNTGAVPVPDPRLDRLAHLAKSAKVIPAQVTFVDIAGLIKGASKGEGLGNQFLGHIRNVDAVAHIVRCFDDPNIVHVDGSVDPARDIDVINTELLLSDLDTVQKLIAKVERPAKTGDKEAKEKLEALIPLEKHLSQGKSARSLKSESAALAETKAMLLSAKPTLFVANVAESEIPPNGEYTPGHSPALDSAYKAAGEQHSDLVIISGKVESEIAELDMQERKAYLESLGLERSGLDRLALAGYKLLNLITFFTVGPKEAHAWTVPQGTLAPQCAGKIHTDFEKGFIRAEVISYDHYIEAGSEVRAREMGKLRVEGKEYVMQDGDIVHFRFNL
ncbi:MAG: redox-regulated ATPase YchF [Proteobacteria bacterium]|nr:MAG: redox-regulated ATPase YchF [Pseudomonadota bacterium]